MLRRASIRKISCMLVFLVVAACAGTESTRSTGTYLDDKTISAMVKTELAADSLTKALPIEVKTYDGVVQLSGFVKDARAIDRAESIARGVGGVKKVINDLRQR